MNMRLNARSHNPCARDSYACSTVSPMTYPTTPVNVRLEADDTNWLDSLSARCSGVSMRERLTRSDVIRALVVVGRRHASEVRAELLEQRAARVSS